MATAKTPKKRKPGRPKGSVKRTSLGEDVNHRLTKGETAMYNNVKDALTNWIMDNGEREIITSPLVALTASGVAKNQPFFFDRLLIDPDISRSIDIIKARLFSRALKHLRDNAFISGMSPKWMEMYLRIIASDKDLGRLTGGVKFGEVANLTVDNRKQINIVAPDAEEKGKKTKAKRGATTPKTKQLPSIDVLEVDGFSEAEVIDEKQPASTTNEEGKAS